MITIIDTIRYSEEHAPFNAAFSKLLSQAFPGQVIEVYFQSCHAENVSKILTKNNVPLETFKFRKIFVYPHKNKSFKILICYLFSVFQDLKFLIRSKRGMIFFTSANPISLYFIKLANLILRKKIYIILHGELEYLNKVNDKLHLFPHNLIRKWYRLIFRPMLNENTKYIVLGENILNNIRRIQQDQFSPNRFLVIDHPYFYPERQFPETDPPGQNKALCVGTIGHTAVAKNSHKLFELAELMVGKITENKISFKIIGNISSDMTPFLNKYVNIQSKTYFMPRDQFEEEVESLSYIVFFYSDAQYQFIASGVFFDAIAFEKPIIALHNSFFDYYFSKYDDIGYLCGNLDEMQTILDNFDVSRYKQQIENIKFLKKDLSIDRIAQTLLSQIKHPAF